MAFDYGCFISYPHDDGALVERFIEEFVEGLKAHLKNLEGKKKYWWDREQLPAGKKHPEAIATGMCSSACWILIYYPKYRRSDDCKREYSAMRDLEARRRQALGKLLARDDAMIIPVLLGGDKEDLPGNLSNHTIFQDFSKYRLSGPRILEHPKSEEQIVQIAEHVWSVWRACETLEGVPPPCHEYHLPEPADDDWGAESGGTQLAQPR